MESVRDNDFVCIEYPAVIENIDKALKTLGGEENISKTFEDPGKRLPLRWRPDEFYCKPAYADRCDTTNLLLKVQKWRRKKKNGRTGKGMQGDKLTGDRDVKYHSEVLGRVSTTYKFQSQADIQFLPMQKTDDGSYKSLIPDIMITKPVPSSELLQKEGIPMFLPPQVFSRLDQPTDYYYRQKQKKTDLEFHDAIEKKDIIGVARKRRIAYTIFKSYHDPIPTEPMAGIEKTEPIIKLGLTDLLEKVKEMFTTERVIWSKSAISHHLYGVPHAHRRLKHVLPRVAYYITTGPWRSLWVKLGFDPRKDPNARHFQMVDFRVRQGIYVKNPSLVYKRSSMNYKLLTSVSKTKPQASTIQVSDTAGEDMQEAYRNENVCKIRPGIIPPYHQMFYQVCDIEVKAVQDLLKVNISEVCTERDGWFTEGTIDEVRDLLNDCVKQSFQEWQKKNPTAAGNDDTTDFNSSQLEDEDFANESQDIQGMEEEYEEEDMDRDISETELMDLLEHGTQDNIGDG
ncbi:general transcription factor 3C polypeptide 5 [Lingula anatina]|uniref:General transcription factor 3C polypeptide 5 n=1 Tax=Lingula anatina TaxID=7574 RepID=A0A1S3JMY6_LINAN|nr:general transcription factor 3C polypeptide 5 [Lingula anatina]|eukprot:XP_013411521.1 general transcription factor 3C polypeptide 5 [Lingula anatina]